MSMSFEVMCFHFLYYIKYSNIIQYKHLFNHSKFSESKKIETIEKHLTTWLFLDSIYYEIFRFDFMLLFYEKHNKYWYNVF